MVHCHAASYLRGVAYGTRWALGVKSIDGFPHLGHGPGPGENGGAKIDYRAAG